MSIVGQILRVAVVAPIYQLFDYLPPFAPLHGSPVRGLRLWVPFGRRKQLGILWDIADSAQCAHDKLKPALEWLDSEPLWSTEDLALLAWTAEYYQYPLGDVLAAALPTRLRQRSIPKAPAPTGWRLTTAGNCADPGKRAPRQLQVLEVLRAHPTGLAQVQLDDLLPNAQPTLRRFATEGWIEPCEILPQRPVAPSKPTLNADQAQAVTAIAAALGRFQAFLLEGITGSGKTEVYLRLLEQVLANGDQALILVPEIGLTPQMQQRLLERLDTRIALLHSARSTSAREVDWQAARAGTASIVLGTRSAVFTPLPRLALIIVDEEHDLSFKQQDGLLYSARDLAVWRAWQRGCPVVLGSATPSLETVQNAILGRYTKLALPVRAGSASSPRLDLIDVRKIRLQAGLSPALIRLLKENLAVGQQSLLFLNRRGYAPLLRCYACGWVAECSHCDARLTLHQKASILWCHHCGTRQPKPKQCPSCQHPKLSLLGQGTERLEQMLSKLFGEVSLARIDRDTTSRQGSLEQLLQEAQAGLHPIILGTQMLAKGHHFPEVTLVGILDLDHGLYGADYRAAERMAQLLIQVAGRAGREQKPGRVAIQTRHPDNPLLQALIHQGYRAFTALALKERQQARLPPFSAQVLLRADGIKAEASMAFLTDAVAAGKQLPPGIEFWGPAPATMERRAKRYRAQLLIQAANRSILRSFLTTWVPELRQLATGSRVRWSLDVDPQEVL